MYKPLQKKNSSWTPSTVQKKGKSPSKLGRFSIQPKPNPSSESSQEIGEYSRTSMDRLAANVMRSLQTREQEIAEESIQPKFQSPWAPTFDPPPPLPQSPASKIKGAFASVSKNPIQRKCAECAKEENEQKGEERKDLDEIGIQTKLTVGAPGDAYEQEADRVASQVMSMSAPADSSASVQRQLDTNHPHHPHQIWQRAQSIKPVVQRQIDPRVQMRQMIQRAHQIDGNQASGDLESRLNASKGGGSPLSENVRGFMEPRFGADFSGVRVHTGGEAVQMNQELGAQAFTHGSDVYFGQGKSPGNNELTAHELTHVVQQTEASNIQRETEPTNSERMLEEAIAVVEQALYVFDSDIIDANQTDQETSELEVDKQKQGLAALLDILHSLRGSGQIDTIVQITEPILMAANGDLDAANQAQENSVNRTETDNNGSPPNVQRMAQALAAPALIGAGPIGWGILAVGLVVTAGVIAYQADRSRSRAEPRVVPRSQPRRRRDRWTCEAQCNVQQIRRDADCPERVQGVGSGPNQEQACRTAKRTATQSAPSGCYARHCRCFNCVRN